MRRQKSDLIGIENGAGSTTTTAVVTTVLTGIFIVVVGSVAIAALAIAISNYNKISVLQKVTTTQATASVWVNSDTGNDSNNGQSQQTPVASIERAFAILQTSSAVEGVIELDGSATHDFGTDTMLDFFPLISLYGTVIIRGRRTNVENVRVTQVDVSSKGHRFVSVSTNITADANTYQKHFVQTSDGVVFIVEEQTALGVFHIVGGNYQASPQPETWYVNQTFVAFQTSTKVAWTGDLTLVASFSRVTFDSIEFIPSTATSQLVAPAYRDDALVMRACKITNIQNTASFKVPVIRTGETGLFPLTLDKRAVLRGSVFLNGGYIEGATANAAFTTQQLDTKTVLYSVWMKDAHMACVSMCNILGMISENPQEVSVFTEASQFYLQGLKAYGVTSDPDCSVIHVADATVFDIANVNVEYAGVGTAGVFISSNAKGQLSVIDVTLNQAPFGLRFGENIVARVSNATITAQYPMSTRTTCSISLVNYHEYFPVGTSTPAMYFERGDRLWLGFTSLIIHWNTSNVAPIFFGHAQVEMGGGIHCIANPAVHCITADYMSDLHILTNFTNENGVTPSNVIKVGANPVGPLNTQTDYAAVGSKYCKLLIP